MSQELDSLLNSCRVQQSFRTFLTDNDIMSTQDVGLMASSEAVFEKTTIPMMRATKVVCDKLSYVIAMKKVWLTCRNSTEHESLTATGKIQHVSLFTPLNQETKQC